MDSFPLGIGRKISVRYRRRDSGRFFSWRKEYDDWYWAAKDFYNLKNSCTRNEVIAVEFTVFVDLESMD